jgi:hypothetical protein
MRSAKLDESLPPAFYGRLAAECGIEIDLDAVIEESRRTHLGPQL